MSAAAPSDIDTGSALFIRETTLGFQMHMNYERIYLAQKMNEIEASYLIFNSLFILIDCSSRL